MINMNYYTNAMRFGSSCSPLMAESSNSSRPRLIDRACLHISNGADKMVQIYGQIDACKTCELAHLWTLAPGKNTSVLVFTQYTIKMMVMSNYSLNSCCGCGLVVLGSYAHLMSYKYNKTIVVCLWFKTDFKMHFKENSLYHWSVLNECTDYPRIVSYGSNIFATFFSAIIVITFLIVNYYFAKFVSYCLRKIPSWRRDILCTNIEQRHESGEPQVLPRQRQEIVELKPDKMKNRSAALDAFRGFVVILTIFINNGGGLYWFFKSAAWDGVTFSDLVDPFFLWIMGFSTILSIHKRLKEKLQFREIMSAILLRTALLYFGGVFLENYSNADQTMGTIRLMGYPQRLAICHFILATLELVCNKFQNGQMKISKVAGTCAFRELLVSWKQWIVVLSFLVIHCIVTYAVKFSSYCPAGYTGPGGLHYEARYINCTGGVAGWIDRNVMNEHLPNVWNEEYHRVYATILPMETAGILSILNAVYLAHMGSHCGRIYTIYKGPCERITRLLANSVLYSVLGALLCTFSTHLGPVPINHRLMSASFIFILGSWASTIFTLLYVLCEVTHGWRGKLFIYTGTNAALLYGAHIIALCRLPFTFKPQENTHSMYLLSAGCSCLIWICIARFLWEKNIFFTV